MLTRRAALVLAVPVALVLLGYVLWPALRTFVLGVEHLPEFFGGWRGANVRALINSVGISLATVAGASVVGTGLAWGLWRYGLPFRGALQAAAALPLALPPLVGVLAFLFLYGETGILPRALRDLFGLAEVPFAFSGLWAVWLVHVYAFYVYFFLFVTAALRDLDASLLEASADLGASGWRAFRRVVIPLLRPALVGASLLVFMLSMASFTAPLLFAGTEPFMTVQIYNLKINGDLALSAAVATVLTAICLGFLFLLEARPGRNLLGASKGTARPVEPVGGPAAWLAGLGVGVVLLFVVLPVLTVVLISFADAARWTMQILPPAYTLANYASLFADPKFFDPIANSLQMASIATVLNVVFGVAAAVVIAKGTVPGRGLIRTLAVLPFAIPGTVVALNLIVTFSQPSPLSAGQVLVGSFWILPLAYFIRHIPLVVRATTAALDGFDDRLTEASADLGAGTWTTFRRVVWPAILPGVAAGTLLTFVAALGEFVSSIMLYVYGNRPISVEILAQLRLYEFGTAAAYSVLLMGLVGLSTFALRFAGNR
ncbi:MAG: iron ABC transporter permease [Rhodothermales bacterium]